MIQGVAPERVDTQRLWGALAEDLRAWLRRRVRDPAAAEDLLQDVFERVHAHRGELHDVHRVGAWVFRIARNAVIDHHRKRRAAEPLADEAPDLVHAQDDEDVAHALGRWLGTMIDTLPEPYAEVLRLIELGGMSQKSAAERLGLSYSGVKSRVQRGRSMLRKLLLRCCDVRFDRRGQVIDYRSRRGASCCS